MRFGYKAVIVIVTFIFKVFYGIKIYRKDPIYPKRAIIAPNHTSYYDPPIVSLAWPEEVHFLATEYLFKVPLFGALIRSLNSHPVQRGGADLKSMKTITAILEDEKKVIIFPEGRRSDDGQIAPIKPGIGMIAYRAKAAIIPVYVHGAYEVWPRTKKFPKLFGKIAVVFGSPILFEEFALLEKREAQEKMVSKLQAKLEELRDWYLNGAQGEIP